MTRIIINPFGRSFPIQKRDSVLSKIDLFPKQVANDLPNKRLAKGFCFIKSLSHLHSKVSLQKGFGKTNLFVKALPFKRRNDFKAKQVSKPFVLPNLPQRTNLNLRYNLMVTLLLSNLERGKVTMSVASQVT